MELCEKEVLPYWCACWIHKITVGVLHFTQLSGSGLFLLIVCTGQYPTKALAPLMLEDYRKVMVERKGEQEQFSVLHIQKCMKKGAYFFLRHLLLWVISTWEDADQHNYEVLQLKTQSLSFLHELHRMCCQTIRVLGLAIDSIWERVLQWLQLTYARR